VDDGLIAEADNPARKVAKPRRLPTTRRALPDTRLAQINEIAARTGDDPELDTLILRLHTETACRRGGALALRPQDLDSDQCLILLREKGETVRWTGRRLAGDAGQAVIRAMAAGMRETRTPRPPLP
jgi:integrase/recombinase XerC